MIPAAGYTQGDVNIPDATRRLEQHVNDLPLLYNEFSTEELLQKPAPGKWSRQEILGHLIDSAINNLKRFTEIQFLSQPYHITPYQQDELVVVNNYHQLPLGHLVQLWQALNRQIIYVVQAIPEEKLNLTVDPQYANNGTKTLGWIIADYVAHMEHHFKQLRSM